MVLDGICQVAEEWGNYLHMGTPSFANAHPTALVQRPFELEKATLEESN